MKSVHDALGALGSPAAIDAGQEKAAAEYKPAVRVRKSLADPNYIVSMIDGKMYRSPTRHIKANGLTPAGYRERYGLKGDHPLVAPAYSAGRSEVAKRLGLGRKKGDEVGRKLAKEAVAAGRPAPKVRKNKSIAAAKAAAKAHLGGGGE